MMIQIDFDAPNRCLLIRIKPGRQTEQDWEQFLASFLLVDNEAHRQQRDALAFIVVEPNAERPNANWRKRLAEQRKQYRAAQLHMVMVTDSTLFRGMLQAVNWLSPPSPREKKLVTHSIQEGIEQVESWRGEPVSFLRECLSSTHKAGA